MNRRVDWVVFDVGGTLVDETRMWRVWAQRIGVGLVSVFLPRGPWGRLHATWPEAADAAVTVKRLTDLVKALSNG